jgi:hypothetical protein
MARKSINTSMHKKKQYLDLLKLLKKLSDNDRSVIIPYLKPEAVEFLCECFHNVLYTDLNSPNKANIKRRLKSSCSVDRLKLIASKSRAYKSKVKALKQEGAGIGLILSAALPFLTSLFSR